MTKPLRAIGLMSGTSMDGIDVAMLTTDGEALVERGPSATYPYPAAFRAQLQQALTDAVPITERSQRPGCLVQIEAELTEKHAAAVEAFLTSNNLHPGDIDVVGFHGQTVLHRPESHLTVQLGNGQLLADRIRIDVSYDLRAYDVASGGQGAPLVPVYHRALAAKLPERPIAFLNIGGVANVTWIGSDGEMLAFDTGPGNALIDDWIHRHTGQTQDTDGAIAAQGAVDGGRVGTMLLNDYFLAPAPKSLDRNTFDLSVVDGLSLADGAATLSAFTAHAVARARHLFPEPPKTWIVCGGGRKNKFLMGMLPNMISGNIAPAEAFGFNGDAMEAEAWAYLAVRSIYGLQITFPTTTGVPMPKTGGRLASGKR